MIFEAETASHARLPAAGASQSKRRGRTRTGEVKMAFSSCATLVHHGWSAGRPTETADAAAAGGPTCAWETAQTRSMVILTMLQSFVGPHELDAGGVLGCYRDQVLADDISERSQSGREGR